MLPCSMGRRGINARGLFACGEGTVCDGGAARGGGGSGLAPVAAIAAGPTAVKLTSWAAKVFADVPVPGAHWPCCLCCLCDMETSLCVVCLKPWQSQNCSCCAGMHQPYV